MARHTGECGLLRGDALRGGFSLVGKAPPCGGGDRGFKSRNPP